MKTIFWSVIPFNLVCTIILEDSAGIISITKWVPLNPYWTIRITCIKQFTSFDEFQRIHTKTFTRI